MIKRMLIFLFIPIILLANDDPINKVMSGEFKNEQNALYQHIKMKNEFSKYQFFDTLINILKTESDKTYTAVIIIDPLGNILAKSPDCKIDENDKVQIVVVGGETLLNDIKLERLSSMSSNTYRVLGVQQATGEEKTANRGFLVEGLKRTHFKTFIFDSFAEGEANIAITRFQDVNNKTNVGNLKFKVNPLYSGMFTLGIVKSDLVERDYKLVNDGTNDVIAEDNDGDNEYLYSLMFTPFIWGRRDIEKEVDWWQRINPTIGISFEDIEDNVFLGLSIDLPGRVLVTVGSHFGKQKSLAKDSGLSVGDTYSGSIPTTEKWEDKFFFAVSFDVDTLKELFSLRESDK